MYKSLKPAFAAVTTFAALACNPAGSPAPFHLSDDPTEADIAPAYAEGTSAGDLRWQLRLNRMQCDHPNKPSTWCAESDRLAAIAASGIEATLISWIQDPDVTAVKITYMTFTSANVAAALCDEAEDRGLDVDIYIQRDNIEPASSATGVYKQLLACADKVPNFRLHGRGTDNWLNHAKIFLAETSDRLRFTSSSANISASGVSLHFDNWLMFDAPSAHRLARQNSCYFDALAGMINDEGNQDKGLFTQLWKACSNAIAADPDATTRFIGVPTGSRMEKPLDSLLSMIDGAQESIKIAAHKITQVRSLPFVDRLVAKAAEGVSVQVVFDDDTILKALHLPGSAGLNVSAEEIAGYEALVEGGAAVTFIDTNEQLGLLMHNKYVIVDDAEVFTGAGNFSKASLTGKNTEQFYVTSEQELVEAYVSGWSELRSWAKDEGYFTD